MLPAASLRDGSTAAAALDAAQRARRRIRRHMIALQEELDWRCYLLYGLVDERS